MWCLFYNVYANFWKFLKNVNFTSENLVFLSDLNIITTYHIKNLFAVLTGFVIITRNMCIVCYTSIGLNFYYISKN